MSNTGTSTCVSPRTTDHRPCGRKAKGEHKGAPMCARHLAGARRSEAAAQAHRDHEAQSAENERVAQAVCADLTRYGIHASPHYLVGLYGASGYTGNIILSNPDELLKLLVRV